MKHTVVLAETKCGECGEIQPAGTRMLVNEWEDFYICEGCQKEDLS